MVFSMSFCVWANEMKIASYDFTQTRQVCLYPEKLLGPAKSHSEPRYHLVKYQKVPAVLHKSRSFCRDPSTGGTTPIFADKLTNAELQIICTYDKSQIRSCPPKVWPGINRLRPFLTNRYFSCKQQAIAYNPVSQCFI